MGLNDRVEGFQSLTSHRSLRIWSRPWVGVDFVEEISPKGIAISVSKNGLILGER